MGTALVNQIPGVEIPREEERALRVACLLYHDVIDGADWDSSGFTGPGTTKYKLSLSKFQAHLAAIARRRDTPAIMAYEIAHAREEAFPFLLTFDDGGESAVLTADLIEKQGWRGHFFVTAAQVGKKGFLSSEQIRALRKKGHVIGSHSFSHPVRMSHCSNEELTDEWTRSVKLLSDILGEQVDTASVPGGYYSNRVGETAASSAIRVLFNSEPTTVVREVGGCLVVGRYNIFKGVPAEVSGDLVSVHSKMRSRQWMYWNVKKIAKRMAGQSYLAAREWVLREK